METMQQDTSPMPSSSPDSRSEAEYPESSPEQVVITVQLEPVDNQRLANLRGPMDSHLRQLERGLEVAIHSHGAEFQVSGHTESVQSAEKILQALYRTPHDDGITPDQIHLLLRKAAKKDDSL